VRFVILREAGGLGDVVRTFPVARGIKARFPGARVDYVCLAGYERLVALSQDVDSCVAVGLGARRKRDEKPDPARHGYVAQLGADDHTTLVDLFCPAYRHEVLTDGAVTLDRVELFCRAAGVEPTTPRLAVPEDAARRARGELRSAFGDRGGPLVGLAPYATHPARSWLGRERMIGLGRALAARGCRLVFFHSWKCRRPGRDEALASEVGAFPALRLAWPLLAAYVRQCDLVVSVDTGVFHLAGAVGTSTLGLFGSTSGEVMRRPYPTHAAMSAGGPSPGCDAPCYGRPSRGYSPEVCGRAGCELMRRLAAGEVTEAACAVLAAGRGPVETKPPAETVYQQRRVYPQIASGAICASPNKCPHPGPTRAGLR